MNGVSRVTSETDFYELTLERTRGGINPWEPWFELIVRPPIGAAPDVISTEPVLHTEQVSRDSKYTSVTIVYGGEPRWTMPVEVLS